MPKVDLSLVIPTYNERENIKELIEKIQHEFKKNKINAEVIIVDDNSPDKTGDIIEDLKKKNRDINKDIKIIHREKKSGLSSAVLEGWKISEGEILGVMDADLSHPVEKIKDLFKAIEKDEADFTIGSRYIKGGKIMGWGFKRKVMSRIANFLARPFTSIKDPMTGFFMIRKKCIKNKNINHKGFKILLELLIKADYQKIKEIPITFSDRKKGKSKAGIKEILLYLNNLIDYFLYQKTYIEFFKFAIIGIIGMIINLIVLYSFTEFFNIYYIFSAVFAFLIAVTSNYFLNKIYTFKEKIKDKVISKGLNFLAVSLIALIINIVFLYIFTEIFRIYYLISQVLAIGIAFLINFIGNKIWTFSK